MDSLANLINQKREELNPILGEDIKLEKERREREIKERFYTQVTIRYIV